MHGHHSSFRAEVDRLLDLLLEEPAPELGQFLDRHGVEDPAVRRELEQLWAIQAESQQFLTRTTALRDKVRRMFRQDAQSFLGRQFGAYRLSQAIGEGGMGFVFLAERADGQYQRQVAVKIMAHDLIRQEARWLFQHEIGVLAKLQHPHIATLLDSGISIDGQPYLIMEFLEGEPIDVYCDRNRLNGEERLRLFLNICEAVGHAHSNQIVHRDIKPSNILVTGTGLAKLLDFGIAQALDSAESRDGGMLRVESMMTPEFAAPEQVRGETVTGACDVYALGNLLYYLLTGHWALPLKGLKHGAVLHAILTKEPQPPSMRSLNSGDAALRGNTPRRLKRWLQGDLDRILLKALAKNPLDRYTSIETFAQDLRDFMDLRPVSVSPPSRIHQLGLLIKRKSLMAAGLASLMAMLVFYGISMVRHQKMTERERDRARKERDAANQVTTFLVDVFRSSNPEVIPGESLSAKDLLDRGTRKIKGQKDVSPEVRHRLFLVLGEVYSCLDSYDEAMHLFEQASVFWRQVPERQDYLIQALCGKAVALKEVDRAHEGLPLALEALALCEQNPSLEQALLADVLEICARLYRDVAQFQPGLPLAQRAVEILGTLPNADPVKRANAFGTLAGLNAQAGNDEEAENNYRMGLATCEDAYPQGHPTIVPLLQNLAKLLANKGHEQEAVPLYQQAVDMVRCVYAPGHSQEGIALGNLAFIQARLGLFDQAHANFQLALEMLTPRLGETHPKVLGMYNNIGTVYLREGKYSAAKAIFLYTLEHIEELDFNDRILVNNLAVALYRLDEIESAESYFRLAFDLCVNHVGLDHPSLIPRYNALSLLLIRLGQFAEAEYCMDQSLRLAYLHYEPGHPTLIQCREALASFLESQNCWEEVLLIRQETVDALQRLYGPIHQDVFTPLCHLGNAQRRNSHFTEAETSAYQALDLALTIWGPDDYRNAIPLGLLGLLEQDRMQYQSAETFFLDAYRTISNAAGPARLIQDASDDLLQLYRAWGKPERVRAFEQAFKDKDATY